MPVLAMFMAALLWSSSVIGSKAAVAQLAITEVVVGRFLFAAALLWLALLLSRQDVRLRGGAARPLLMGLLDPGLVSLFMVWGLSHTAALNAAVFWALLPILMPLLGRLVLGESIRGAVMIGALIAFAGALVLVLANRASGEGSLFGDLLAVCGVMCAAVNGLLARRVAQQERRPIVITAYQMSMAIVVGAGAMLLLERPPAPFGQISGDSLVLLAYLGLIATAGPFFLLNYALQHMPVGRVGLFSSLVGPMALPMAALFLGEAVSLTEIGAVAVVMLGVFLPSLTELPAVGRLTGRPRGRRDLRERPPWGTEAPLAEPPLRSLDDRVLEDLTFVVFDTETTGLEPSNGDRIVQIGAVRVVGGEIQHDEVFDELVHPGRSIPARSTRFHGITDEMVAAKPPVDQVLRQFHEFCGDCVLVAHNAAFDLKFLEIAQGLGGPTFAQPVLDTLLLSAVLERKARDHGLDAIAQRHGINLVGRHTALGDSLATAEVFLCLLPLAQERGTRTLGEAIRLSNRAWRLRRMQKRF
ncbi:MAG: exonuclease domain-containing protein [Alphaproteobacteria bacterium]|jgi:DNA polymerase III epsilon subunit|nr:exonuclease domain-containing protein [Alphaproteobacteria bacterium]MDP6814476.1 exonuclease domain-containing protein [Alphaproteobacteria bacterium]